MATVSLVTSAGIASIATPVKLRSVSVVTQAGLYSAPRDPPWSGATPVVQRAPWLPRADIPWFDPNTGKPTAQFAAFMKELAENRMGGIRGKSIAAVQEDLVTTQTQVASTVNYTEQAVAYTTGLTASVSAVIEVAKSNSLTGSASIPAPPEPPVYTVPPI